MVQQCLLRDWPLISADYRLTPQASSTDILDDARAAYDFVQKEMPGILKRQTGKVDVIIIGPSAGKSTLMVQWYVLDEHNELCLLRD